MLKQDLEKQLNDLRLKWKIFPKSSLEPNWFKFKCDKTLALRLIHQIENFDGEKEILASDLTQEQVKDIFK